MQSVSTNLCVLSLVAKQFLSKFRNWTHFIS